MAGDWHKNAICQVSNTESCLRATNMTLATMEDLVYRKNKNINRKKNQPHDISYQKVCIYTKH